MTAFSIFCNRFCILWSVHECKDLTSVFMRFAEHFLTDGKNDKDHTATVKSCLLRVPYTINSKYNDVNEVQIIQSAYSYGSISFTADSNGSNIATTAAAVQYILKDFRYYLFDNRAKVKMEELKRAKKEMTDSNKQMRG